MLELNHASPYRDGGNTHNTVSCSLRRGLARHLLSRGSRGSCRSVGCNLSLNRNNSSKGDQEFVSDLAFPQQASSGHCGRGTAGKYRAAFPIPLLKIRAWQSRPAQDFVEFLQHEKLPANQIRRPRAMRPRTISRNPIPANIRAREPGSGTVVIDPV